MWFERFVIIVTGLHRDYLPSSWGYFRPSLVDISTFTGTFGLFFTLYLLFVRYLPLIAASEVKGVMPSADPHAHGHDEPGEAAHAAGEVAHGHA
jgi:molybdopterin-containing oxidoreductase family membrane subunit